MQNTILLLTGIPRSGTTLACKLLNSAANTIALHEPLTPNKISSDNAIENITNAFCTLNNNLLKGESIEHGDSNRLVLDNPIQSYEKANSSIRKVVAKRGLLTLPPISQGHRIVIKQNAMFAALSAELKRQYAIVAIIRNPIDVLTSWMSVDLPVNHGRIPGGEKFCPELKQKLNSEPDVLQRQLIIYRWFLTQFTSNNITTIKYEDIISSKGNALFKACNVPGKPDTSLCYRHAKRPDLKTSLTEALGYLDAPVISQFYSNDEIKRAYDRTTECE